MNLQTEIGFGERGDCKGFKKCYLYKAEFYFIEYTFLGFSG